MSNSTISFTLLSLVSLLPFSLSLGLKFGLLGLLGSFEVCCRAMVSKSIKSGVAV